MPSQPLRNNLLTGLVSFEYQLRSGISVVLGGKAHSLGKMLKTPSREASEELMEVEKAGMMASAATFFPPSLKPGY